MTDSIPMLWNHWSLVSCHYCPVFTGTILRWPCPGKNVSRLRLCTDMCRGLGITGHSESCPGPGPRVPSVRTLRDLRESREHRDNSPATSKGNGNSLRDFPPFSVTSETPELLTKICLCLEWTVAEMGQRIPMGILLSSRTISISQTFYYDQSCNIVTCLILEIFN